MYPRSPAIADLPVCASAAPPRRPSLAPVGFLLVGLAMDVARASRRCLDLARAVFARRRALVRSAVGGPTKRAIDIAAAGAALLVLSPIMILVAILIWTTQGGPVIFSHPRVGQGGRSFPCYKFRTMVTNGDKVLRKHLNDNPHAANEWRETRKLRRDPRITRLGRFLRKSSLDELPQLFNILIGHMSCVGPRPVVTVEIARYGRFSPYYLAARPGLTGMWQISGRNSISYDERVSLDAQYVGNWSLWLDLRIMVLTIPALVRVKDCA
jgi:exopolysaccharide production protein ExoY